METALLQKQGGAAADSVAIVNDHYFFEHLIAFHYLHTLVKNFHPWVPGTSVHGGPMASTIV